MKNWIKIGLGWGIWMFLAMAFIWPLIDGEEITLKLVNHKVYFLDDLRFSLWIFNSKI